jgi:hypothetical protein
MLFILMWYICTVVLLCMTFPHPLYTVFGSMEIKIMMMVCYILCVQESKYSVFISYFINNLFFSLIFIKQIVVLQ